MKTNDLVGPFDIEAYQSGDIAKGIQESAEAVFSEKERTNRYLDRRQLFDDKGTWNSRAGGGRKPSVWTHFWGGRRDFFVSPRYREFAERMVPYTYLYRVDE